MDGKETHTGWERNEYRCWEGNAYTHPLAKSKNFPSYIIKHNINYSQNIKFIFKYC